MFYNKAGETWYLDKTDSNKWLVVGFFDSDMVDMKLFKTKKEAIAYLKQKTDLVSINGKKLVL